MGVNFTPMGVKLTPRSKINNSGKKLTPRSQIQFNTLKIINWEDNLGGEKVAVHLHHQDCSIGVGRLFEHLVQDHWDSNLHLQEYRRDLEFG